MPVHWYYDQPALRRDYGVVDRYLAPRNPHPGSILWRSNYEALNERADILRKQALQLRLLHRRSDAGGDNCHRGAVVGSLLGAATAELWIPTGGTFQ